MFTVKIYKPASTLFLSIGGLLLGLMGLYFVFLRPSLLPEDAIYIGTSLSEMHSNIPGLSTWLNKVFFVLGLDIFTTGTLIIYLAQTSFRMRMNGVFLMVLLSGLTSIGAMTAVNFILQSDFRWVLLSFTIPWFISLVLYLLHR